MARNRYVKLQLAERCSTNLQGATVVGQSDDFLLVERPQPKRAAGTRKPRTNAKPSLADRAMTTAFPPPDVARG